MFTTRRAEEQRAQLGPMGESNLRELMRRAGYGPEITDIDGPTACTLVWLANQDDTTIEGVTEMLIHAQTGKRHRDRARIVASNVLELIALSFAQRNFDSGVHVVDELRRLAGDLRVEELIMGDVFSAAWQHPRGI